MGCCGFANLSARQLESKLRFLTNFRSNHDSFPQVWLRDLPVLFYLNILNRTNALIISDIGGDEGTLFQDTSLIVILGLFDILTTHKISLTEPSEVALALKPTRFAALGYLIFCYAL